MTEIAQVNKRTIDRMQVRLEHLDKLLSLAGEVIITSANLQDLERRATDATDKGRPLPPEGIDVIKTSNEAARRVSQDLHELVMAIRLIGIGETFRLFRRPVRDLCRKLGREVDLVFEGDDTLIDKALAERLVDPLLHLLRNAVDHGIEAPMERSRAGKEAKGRILVSAVDREHHTEIRVSDDGAGVDATQAREAARAAGLKADVDTLPLLDLLCVPGFTMAASVTATSGRGVGLDLVRSVVEEFDGEMELQTEPGKGTAFLLKIPKLRAVNIIDALTLRAGPSLYALPIEQVIASLGVRRDQVQTAMDRSRYFVYQGSVVVLRDLQELLGSPSLEEETDPLPVVIVQGRTGRLALIVSEFLGPAKLVNIPFEDGMEHDPGVIGTTVFTGGRLGLTVDIDALVSSGHGHQASNRLSLSLDQESDSPAGDAVGTGASGVSGAASSSAASPTSGVVGDPQGAHQDAASGENESLRKGVSRRSLNDLEPGDTSALVEELRHHVQRLQDALLTLESDPEETSTLNEAFRRLHAAKGNLTMLGAEAASSLAHHVETIMDYLRGDRVPLTPERSDLLLDCVSYLAEVAASLPGGAVKPSEELLARVSEEADVRTPAHQASADGELIGKAFELSPTVQLQVLSALKRGERTYETYLEFQSGRQADFLTAYLILRRLGIEGTVLASIPSVASIEQGTCGNALKVLWSTSLDEAGLEEVFDLLARQYDIREHSSMPTTIFRYEHDSIDEMSKAA